MKLPNDDTTDFDRLLKVERESINERRRINGREDIKDSCSADAWPVYDTVGLALSGGGIRSAAISLGILQAINDYDVLSRIDYLSTVSGGGFTGASLTTTLTCTQGKFVFSERSHGSPIRADASSKTIGQLRNHSNYLLPGGKGNFGQALSVIVRGLVVNVSIVMWVLLALAAATIVLHRDRTTLQGGVEQYVATPFIQQYFSFTIHVAIFAFLFFLLSTFVLSAFRAVIPNGGYKDPVARVGAVCLFLLALVFSFELQLFLISGMFDAYYGPADSAAAFAVKTITELATTALPTAALVAFFQRKLGPLIERANGTSDLGRSTIGVTGKAVLWLAGAALPLAIWIFYLHLSFWGIENNAVKNFIEPLSGAPQSHTRSWLLALWEQWFQRSKFSFPMFVFWLYSIIALLLAVLSFFLLPNTLSLHGLYRDRLRKAFLFDPRTPTDYGFAPVEGMRVSDINVRYAPYHLINTALNIRGSEYANQKTRDADFFVFSPKYAGSLVTGYLPMREFERADATLDLASAIAISGAAISSSMGAKSIRPLAPTLALLNIRLGYWLRNPKKAGGPLRSLMQVFGGGTDSLLWSEITGRVYADTSAQFYLTDGGHIENLGIYELLRRRCRVIVCIDAEADPEMRFSSFITLQRYVSIDLGIYIELRWDAIQAMTIDWMGYDPVARRGPKLEPSPGPHAAIGIIHYNNGQLGYLLYIKSSLTGDERDFVRDYSRRYSQFPHEPTGKQFFNEEQFEVYRVLGLHMAYGVFSGRDRIQLPSGLQVSFEDADPLVKAVREALLPQSNHAPIEGTDVLAAR